MVHQLFIALPKLPFSQLAPASPQLGFRLTSASLQSGPRAAPERLALMAPAPALENDQENAENAENALVTSNHQSMQVILLNSGLQDYYRFFEKADFTTLDVHLQLHDLEVEQILLETEVANGISFRPDVRVQIWKAIRLAWSRAAAQTKPYVNSYQVPPMPLPKPDFKPQDLRLKWAEIDPDRQRQLERKTVRSYNAASELEIQVQQFEVWKRPLDVLHQFQDIQRCVNELEQVNPRTLTKEDPREEVLKMRIKDVATSAEAYVQQKLKHMAKQSSARRLVQFLMLASAAMCFFMLYVARTSLSHLSPMLFWDFFIASGQLRSSVAFLLSAVVAYSISQRASASASIKRMKKIMLACERLGQQISDFRINTDKDRMPKGNGPRDVLIAAVAEHRSQANREGKVEKPRRRQKPTAKTRDLKADFDPDRGLRLWIKDPRAKPEMMRLQADIVERQIRETYRRLPLDLPSDNKRQGGERRLQFLSKLGGVPEEKLTVNAHQLYLEMRQEKEEEQKEQLRLAAFAAPLDGVATPLGATLPSLATTPLGATLPSLQALETSGAFALRLGASEMTDSMLPAQPAGTARPMNQTRLPGALDHDSDFGSDSD